MRTVKLLDTRRLDRDHGLGFTVIDATIQIKGLVIAQWEKPSLTSPPYRRHAGRDARTLRAAQGARRT